MWIDCKGNLIKLVAGCKALLIEHVIFNNLLRLMLNTSKTRDSIFYQNLLNDYIMNTSHFSMAHFAASNLKCFACCFRAWFYVWRRSLS